MAPNKLLTDLRLLISIYRGSTMVHEKDLVDVRVAVIMGAQVLKGGRPSRTLDARVRHAVNLYHSGDLDLLVPTGGLGEYQPKEADLMTQMLVESGVPRKIILPEDAALNTRDSANRVARLAAENGIGCVRVISDPLHCIRTVWSFEVSGLNALAEPAYDSPMWRRPWSRRGQLLREVIASIWYRVKHRR